MLGHRLGRQLNINQILGQRLVFAGILDMVILKVFLFHTVFL